MSKTAREGELAPGKKIVHLPALEHFQKIYGKTMEGNDQKAVSVFKSYESHEKLRRLQNELSWIKDGKVATPSCDRVIGKKRKGKYLTYERWAQLMLLWITQARR